ncbi:hypothetical protein C6P44_004402 [Monosporozyma unispora]|nr:hypothetical protein C6P44_004402 [Kazachstania unispora]
MNSVPSRNNTIGYCDSDDEDDYHDTVLLKEEEINFYNNEVTAHLSMKLKETDDFPEGLYQLS